jgi:hypothetical protein
MSLAGDLITMVDQDNEFLNNITRVIFKEATICYKQNKTVIIRIILLPLLDTRYDYFSTVPIVIQVFIQMLHKLHDPLTTEDSHQSIYPICNGSF